MKSLYSAKTPGEMVAEILMSRSGGFSGSFLLVEGEDDSRFFRPRVHAKLCEIVIGGGKNAVTIGMHKLDERNFRGALGVVDADFDTVELRSLRSSNLLRTDAHDLEAMLVRSRALESVLAEYGNPSQIRSFEATAGMTVREALLERALPFGRLRWVSARRALAMPFERMPCKRFIDVTKWALDDGALLREACSLAGHSDDSSLRLAIAELPDADPWHVVRGHDLVDILALGLERVLGASKPGRDRVATVLRHAIETAELEETGLVRDIRLWEKRNVPFRVMRRADERHSAD